jgi:polyphenol oxidase
MEPHLQKDLTTSQIEMIQDHLLEACHPQIMHGFFGRQGGVSQGIYSSLNCGAGSADNQDDVQENKRRVVKALGDESWSLLNLHQVHSPDCVDGNAVWAVCDKPQADAIVTDQPGHVIGILTADCCPVLFYGEKENGDPVIGGAHAGWKGAFAGVLQNTVASMLDKGALKDTLRAVIGPTIGPQSYEVGDEFRKDFLLKDLSYRRFFMENNGGVYFDLPAFCAFVLKEAGVKKVSDVELDTYSNEEKFFSYRRATHRNEPDYGRQVAAIVIR